MDRKTEEMYGLVFAYVQRTFGEWAPQTVTSDFERAIQNTLRATWPDATVVGCWFHSANCMNKNAKKRGLYPLLRVNPHAMRVYKMTQALPLLPAHRTMEGYEYIVGYSIQHGLHAIMNGYLSYVQRVWLDGVGANSFSVYKQKMRTDNSMESYHRKVRDVMGRPHPNVWMFTDGLRRLENEAVTTLASLRRGLNAVRPARPQYLLADSRIVILTDRLDNAVYTVGQFLEAASHRFNNIHNEVYNNVQESEDEDVGGLVAGWLPPDPEPQPARRGRGGGRGHGRGRRGRGRGRVNQGAINQQAEAVDPAPEAAIIEVNVDPAVFEDADLDIEADAVDAAPAPAVIIEAHADPAVFEAPAPPPVPNAVPVTINQCLACLENRQDMMLAVPCGHLAICEVCAIRLADQEHCVACRQQIVGLHRIQILNH